MIPITNAVLTLYMTVLLKYLDHFHIKCAKFPFLGAYFSNFPPIFQNFALCFYQCTFPKTLLAKLAHPYFQEVKELNTRRKPLFNNGKVHNTITCRECFKPRCINALRKLNKLESALVQEIDDSRMYTCGSELFPPSSCHYDTIVVCSTLLCSDKIYYSIVQRQCLFLKFVTTVVWMKG